MNRRVINYDKQTDTLTLYFNDNVIESSEQIAPGVIVDYDAEGHVVGVEILDAADSWFEKMGVNTYFDYGEGLEAAKQVITDARHELAEATNPYIFTTVWSEENQKFIGLCDRYPNLSYLHKDEEEARQGIIDHVAIIEWKRGRGRRKPKSAE